MTSELVTINGLQQRLRLPFDWLKAEAEAGGIPCLRVGRRLLFNVEAVRTELAQRAALEKRTASTKAAR